MSNDLINFDTLEYKDIAKLTGATVREYINIPLLRVNREPEDDEGRTLPMGSFCVTQNDMTVYGKSALFRLFINSYQYLVWDANEKKFSNKSVIFKNFFDEIIDEQGGKACGKVPNKQLDSLSTEEQLRQKAIKCRRNMYGLVTIPDASTVDGDVVEVKELPVLFKLSGRNFMAPNDALNVITRSKHQFFQHNLRLGTQRHKTGSNIRYEITFDPIMKEELKFTEDNFQTFKMFQEIIDRENGAVAAKWRAAKKAEVRELDTDLLKELELDDELPELMS